MNKKIVAIIAVIVIVFGGGAIALKHHTKNSAGTYSAKTMTPKSMMKHDGIILEVTGNDTKVDSDNRIISVLSTKKGVTTTYSVLGLNSEAESTKSTDLTTIGQANKLSDAELISKYKALNATTFKKLKKHYLADPDTSSKVAKADLNHVTGKSKISRTGYSYWQVVSNNMAYDSETDNFVVNKPHNLDMQQSIQPIKVGDVYYAGYAEESTDSHSQLITRTNENTKVTLK